MSALRAEVRYSAGVIPAKVMNTRWKLCRELKPDSSAILSMRLAVPASSVFA